ncbi:MAG: diaminopimelate aminotransferase [Deltaproteobacteria bacterium HGW-Deltaproteobacteria-8]|jgi:succinyl-diaminopimelate desuccinylase|nr:MAG: diaminopimelate aminotransferase [Deltaproteobacteria bacterium HGW-Deltaproteobacteria-8]
MPLPRRICAPALLLLMCCVLSPPLPLQAAQMNQAEAAERVLAALDKDGREVVVALHRTLAAIPSSGPESGGPGESKKAAAVLAWLRELGLGDVQRVDLPDARVPSGVRPNFALVLPGRDTSRTLWIISHLDTVPPGDRKAWTGDPYTLRVQGDLMYGRGAEDDHQGIVSGLLLARALVGTRLVPPLNLGLLFVSDEEVDDTGINHVLKTRPDLLRPTDLILIPDGGTPDARTVILSEKKLLWLKFTVLGKQGHGSEPDKAVNTLTAAADLIMRLRGLYNDFPAQDPKFDPPASTFEATKLAAGVESVNMIPGQTVFYMDMRLLPTVPASAVRERVRQQADAVEHESGVRVRVEVESDSVSAPETPADAEVALRLFRAIRAEYGVEPTARGMGGRTFASDLRAHGLPCAVWMTATGTWHQPDERSSISNNLRDARVVTRMLFEAGTPRR